MNITAKCIRTDREYLDVVAAAREQMTAVRSGALAVSGLSGATQSAFVSAFISDFYTATKKGTVIIVPDEKDAARITGSLVSDGYRAYNFCTRDLNIYNISASHEREHERLLVMSKIYSGEFDAVVMTPPSALMYTMPKEVFDNRIFEISKSETLSPEELCGILVSMGYSRTEMVDSIGQFAVRGGIVDLFAPCEGEEQNPTRIEFFGDEIDRMGYFDVGSQRIIENTDHIKLIPVHEILVDDTAAEQIKKQVASLLKSAVGTDAEVELRGELAALTGDLPLNFIDKYVTAVYPQKQCILDWFDKRTAVLVLENSAVNERAQGHEKYCEELQKELILRKTVSAKCGGFTAPSSVLQDFYARNVALYIDAFSARLGNTKLAGLFSLKCRHTISYANNFALLEGDIKNFLRGSYRIILLCTNDAEAKNISSLLTDSEIASVCKKENEISDLSKLNSGIVYITVGSSDGGFELFVPKIAVLSVSSQESARSSRKKHIKKYNAGQKIMSYADLNAGDYVVHAAYGIGKYLGIENLTVNGISRDYINIQYAGADKLFLPVDQLEMVSKYIGAHSDDGLLKLSKMGGGEWQKAKSRAKGAVKDMAKELIALYAARLRQKGFAFPPDDEMQSEFDSGFEYEETECQTNALEEIKSDMMKEMPMDRLLCGDVGYGKTEVALRAAFKAISAGKQVAFLVPTTILAYQHYQTALSRMRGFPVSVEMISRFRNAKQQAEIVRRIARGDIDLIIGTHRLISKDIKFRDLGLLIIDEEQRFGVAQKEKLKQLAKNIDVLSLSATPIPRTLNMALGGIRDMSVLDEPPDDRLPVQTYVLEHDELIIGEAIRRELSRGGQVFYLHNRVESTPLVAGRLAREFPSAKIAVAHGQMSHDEIEEIWQSLVEGEIDILVSTTIIETGIDVPNANTLIIENADRFGLSQLHQLRGRVGRSGRLAYAYFTYRQGKAISEIAEKRLAAIKEYAEFGAGFKVALRDLEIRGAGNMLGAQQHGHLDAVGYDMYIKLLNEAVLEEKGEKVKKQTECKIDLPLDAFISDKYIPSAAGRMEMYKKIALIGSREDLYDVSEELCDRYGEYARPVANLLSISLVRRLASACGIESVSCPTGEIKIQPEKINIELWSQMAYDYTNRIRLVMSGKPYISYKLKRGEDMLDVLEQIFIDCKKYVSADENDGEKK